MDHTVNHAPGSKVSATHEAEMGGLATFIRGMLQEQSQMMPAHDLMTMTSDM